MIPIFVLLLFFFGCLYVFFPVIVYFQLRMIRQAIEDAARKTAKRDQEILLELRVANAHSRQLLRAYGHEPEC